MRLQRLDHPTNPEHGGVLCTFPSGATKAVQWPSAGYITDTHKAAVHAATELVDHMLRVGLIDDLERTNIPSCVAAIQAVMVQHNEAWLGRTGVVTQGSGLVI
jgi:hypothetical protein